MLHQARARRTSQKQIGVFMAKKSAIGTFKLNPEGYKDTLPLTLKKINTSHHGMTGFQSTNDLMRMLQSGQMKRVYGAGGEYTLND
jgi:hypothetical protein